MTLHRVYFSLFLKKPLKSPFLEYSKHICILDIASVAVC